MTKARTPRGLMRSRLLEERQYAQPWETITPRGYRTHLRATSMEAAVAGAKLAGYRVVDADPGMRQVIVEDD